MLDGLEGRDLDTLSKKVLIVTKGKDLGCTDSVEIATQMWDREFGDNPIKIEMFVFDPAFKPEDENARNTYSVLFDIVGPANEPHAMGGIAPMHDGIYRKNLVTEHLGEVCLSVMSLSGIQSAECHSLAAVVHMGKTCGDWTKAITEREVTLRDCRDAAFSKNFKGFVHVAPVGSNGGPDDEWNPNPNKDSNCFVDEEEKAAKRDQIDEKGNPVQTTCTYVAPQFNGTDDAVKYASWSAQPLANTDTHTTSHYRVLNSEADCKNINTYNQFVYTLDIEGGDAPEEV